MNCQFNLRTFTKGLDNWVHGLELSLSGHLVMDDGVSERYYPSNRCWFVYVCLSGLSCGMSTVSYGLSAMVSGFVW